MAVISTLAIWIGDNDGSVVIEWFSWKIITTPGFFLLALIFSIFAIYLILASLIIVIRFPYQIRSKIQKNRIVKSQMALQDGLLSSTYGNKEQVNKSLTYANKYLKENSLLLLLKLQSSILNKNEKDTFLILSKMLSKKTTKPLAIKGLINYAQNKGDIELFKNVLNKALSEEINFYWIMQNSINFCIEYKSWIILSEFLEKKISINDNRLKHLLSLINFQVANNFYISGDYYQSKIYCKKAIKLNKYFPPIIELYCKLKLFSSNKELNNKLKDYWGHNPHPDIEKCFDICYQNESHISRLKRFSKILVKNDKYYFKYLILGKLKYKAKIWGNSKEDLIKSINLKPTRAAYYHLYKIEKKFSNNQLTIQKWEKLYNNTSSQTIWNCNHCKVSFKEWNIFCINCKKFNTIFFNYDKHKSHKSDISGNFLDYLNTR